MTKPSTVGGPEMTAHWVPGPIVDTTWLGESLNTEAIRLLDIRSIDAYQAGHIPNAIQVDLPSLSREINGVPGMILPPDEYAAAMTRFCVTRDRPVVLYDDNRGMAAARVYWGLVRYGHENVAVLNGGWDRWKEEGRPIDQHSVVPTPARFVVLPDDSQFASFDWLQIHAGDPDLVIVDTRTPDEFAQGHLPGAISWNWMNGVPAGSWNAVRPASELRSELEAKGITPDKEVVTYCRSGVRAAHTYLILRHLGYPNVRNYDGSWLEWSHYTNGNG